MLNVYHVNEGSTARYTATLVDEFGDPIPSGTLSGLELWLFDVKTVTIINNRGTLPVLGSGQNVLNDNDVTVDTDGLLTWELRGVDNAVVGSRRSPRETHVAVFRATWGSGKTATHEFALHVLSLWPLT